MPNFCDAAPLSAEEHLTKKYIYAKPKRKIQGKVSAKTLLWICSEKFKKALAFLKRNCIALSAIFDILAII